MSGEKKVYGAIYTKGGDKGQTSLYDGVRVGKDDVRVDAYGTVDEMGAYLGFSRSFIEDEDLKQEILDIQNKLFVVNHNLATSDPEKITRHITEEDITVLEKLVDKYMEKAGDFEGFIINGTSPASGVLHIARTVCRRAERRIIALSREVEIDPLVIKFINRLSDVIYSFAKYSESQIIDVEWDKKLEFRG